MKFSLQKSFGSVWTTISSFPFRRTKRPYPASSFLPDIKLSWRKVKDFCSFCPTLPGHHCRKLFRTKMCLWLNPISVNLLCNSKSSQLVYSLQPLKVLPSSAYHLGRPYIRWAMLPLMPQWSHHTWVTITWIFSTRVYTLMCTRSCSACRLHLFAIRLGRTQLSSGH